MPNQRRKASERPAAKPTPILKRASTSNPNFIPMKDITRIDIEVKNQRTNLATRCRSSLLMCFDLVKLVKKKMPEFLMTSKDSGYWPNEGKQDL